MTPWTVALQVSLSFTVSQSLLKFISTESVLLSNHLIFCVPLLLLPSIFPGIRVFSSELAYCIRWPKCWNFSFSISPSNEYSGLIFFRIGVLSPCCPRDSQESCAAPQFESISSLVLRLLHGPTLTSIHNYWKNHSFDYVDLQCCISFCCTAKWLLYIYILCHILIHYALSQDTEYSSLCYAVGPCCLSIIYIYIHTHIHILICIC